MAEPKFNGAEVRPLKRVFVNNRMIGPDERVKTYLFTGDELPANTIIATDPVPAPAKQVFGDMKPGDAKAAVAKKAKGLTGTAEME